MSDLTRISDNDKSQDKDDPTDLSSSSDTENEPNKRAKKEYEKSKIIGRDSQIKSTNSILIEIESEDDNLKRKTHLKHKRRSPDKEVETITLISDESDNDADKHTQHIDQIDLDTTDVSTGSDLDDEEQLRKAIAMSLQPPSDDDRDDNDEGVKHKTQPMASKKGNLEKGKKFTSPIRMIKSENYEKLDPTCNEDAVSLRDLIGSPDLISTYQFNMMIDCDFILPHINADPMNLDIFVIHNGEDLNLKPEHKLMFKITPVKMTVARYGSHHTKMMVNFYKDRTCQLVIHTMNLTEMDYHGQTQMCWISPRLHQLKLKSLNDEKNTENQFINQPDFKIDFINYLKKYKKIEIDQLVQDVSMYDFTPIKAEFLSSAPGNYEINLENNNINNKEILFGYGKLYQLFHKHKLTIDRVNSNKKTKFVAQVSSIAAPFDSNSSNIFTHILNPIMVDNKEIVLQPGLKSVHDAMLTHQYEPVLIWPTVDEVMNAMFGYLSGFALFFQKERKFNNFSYKNQYEVIKNFFYRWSSKNKNDLGLAGRKFVSPHVKTYTSTSNEFENVNWFLLTSANLSKFAWGGPTRGYGSKGDARDKNTIHKYEIKSFEAGILIHPELYKIEGEKETNSVVELVPVFGSDELEDNFNNIINDIKGEAIRVPIRFPYDIPLTKYSQGDEPWDAVAKEKAIANANGSTSLS
ncbi:hypothetical protein B5S28_g2829 [[Candida] boidinii]|nr:hypothetical protein B5S28_g2829 [[Candida] boidinii]OWB63268.1 hypothetical protein B5S29_g4233 [[Candida] boidinii]